MSVSDCIEYYRVEVDCDSCGESEVFNEIEECSGDEHRAEEEAGERLKEEGWHVSENYHLCPKCKEAEYPLSATEALAARAKLVARQTAQLAEMDQKVAAACKRQETALDEADIVC
jgi:hypothetical protein